LSIKFLKGGLSKIKNYLLDNSASATLNYNPPLI
jgi:hypothetical protein